MISSWANWVVSVATDTVKEIIAEGAQEFAGAKAAASTSAAQRCLWDPLEIPISSPTAPSFWQQNPMQWRCLVLCMSHEINTFIIPPTACFEHAETRQLLQLIGVATPSTIAPLSADSKRKMIKESEALAILRYDLVPRWIEEPVFWDNFAWRAHVLAQTSSVEHAVKLLSLLNTEHREIAPVALVPPVSSTAVKEKNEKNVNDDDDDDDRDVTNNNNDANAESTTTTTTLSSSSSASPDPKPEKKNQTPQQRRSILDQLLLSSPSFIANKKPVPYADVLRRRGFGAAQRDEALMQDLAERIHATAEKETWINNFTSRAGKQLESVHSSVAMLSKLLSEVDDILAKAAKQQQRQEQQRQRESSQHKDPDELDLDQEEEEVEEEGNRSASSSSQNAAAMPPLELLQSVAESCKFHKGRVAALIGELEPSPEDRVAGTALDPAGGDSNEGGKLHKELKAANQRLGDVLARQIATMRVLGEASQERERSASHATSRGGITSPAAIGNYNNNNRSLSSAAAAASANSSNTQEAVFNPVMPWDD